MPPHRNANKLSNPSDRLRQRGVAAGKIKRELEWRPAETFDSGIRKTVAWFLEHSNGVDNVQSCLYRKWVDPSFELRA
jgi:dTDP-glucose 4,6-dehydratase